MVKQDFSIFIENKEFNVLDYQKLTSRKNHKWFIFDTEFVDNHQHCALIQFAYKIYQNDHLIEEDDFYLNPKIKLPERVKNLTGISDQTLSNEGLNYQEGLAKIIKIFLKHYQDVIFVGHSIQSDFHIIFRIIDKQDDLINSQYLEFQQLWTDNLIAIYDTQEAEKKLSKTNRNLSLEKLMERHDLILGTDDLHNALYDIKAIKLIFDAQIFKWLDEFDYLPLVYVKKKNEEEQKLEMIEEQE